MQQRFELAKLTHFLEPNFYFASFIELPQVQRKNVEGIQCLTCCSLRGLAKYRGPRLCSTKDSREPRSLVNLQIQVALRMIFVRKLRFPSYTRANVGCKGPLGTAREQP